MKWILLIAVLCMAGGCDNASSEDRTKRPGVAAQQNTAQPQSFKERVISDWARAGVPVDVHEWNEKRTGRLGIEHRHIIATFRGEKSMEAFEAFARMIYEACRADILSSNADAEAKRICLALYASDFPKNHCVLLVESHPGQAIAELPEWSGVHLSRNADGLQPWRDLTQEP